MKIQLLSDLHLEFYDDEGSSFIRSLDPTDVDVLVLAGDISNFLKLKSALHRISMHYAGTPIIYVPGNHDHWQGSFEEVAELRKDVSSVLKNFHWLYNDIYEQQGVRFLGTTLWFHDPIDSYKEHYYADFRMIKNFRDHVYKHNDAAKKFLTDNLKEGDVVITHMAPSYKSIVEKFRLSKLNCFYVCNMENLIFERKPELWLHGHMHSSLDYLLGDTYMVCNPRGYVDYEENPEFNPKLICEI